MSTGQKSGFGTNGEWIFALIFGAALFALLKSCGNDEPAQEDQRPSTPSWYEGGTLQNATVGEWKAGTYQNRLASSADFAAVVVKNSGRSLNNMDELRPIARNFEACISEAAKADKADSVHVNDLAAACAVLMKI
jgi:hypothetical protein